MQDPHHLAGDWQSCDLDLVAEGQKQLQARVMSPDLEGGSFRGLGATGKSRLGSLRGTGSTW